MTLKVDVRVKFGEAVERLELMIEKVNYRTKLFAAFLKNVQLLRLRKPRYLANNPLFFVVTRQRARPWFRNGKTGLACGFLFFSVGVNKFWRKWR